MKYASAFRTLTAERYPEMQIQVQVNKNLIDFYNIYLTSDINDNFMTRWAIVYEYDDKVWGHDRAFFAEESMIKWI